MINVAGLQKYIEDVYNKVDERGSRHNFVSNFEAVRQAHLVETLQSVDFYARKTGTLNGRLLDSLLAGSNERISKELRVVSRELRRMTVRAEKLDKYDSGDFIQDVKEACKWNGGLMTDTTHSGLIAESLIRALGVE